MSLTSWCINSSKEGGISYPDTGNAILLDGCFAAEGGGGFNMGVWGNNTAGNTHDAGPCRSEGTGTIPAIRNGEVPDNDLLMPGPGMGSFTGCWADAFHAKARCESWKGKGVGVGGVNMGNVCFPADEVATKELSLLLVGLPTPTPHFSSSQVVAHHTSIGQLSPMMQSRR